ncbi:MAG: hypothetical protein KGI52_11290 [Burkholderiales bacterium]|nr:hypothetical protein [Burkholderiales bacterium]
MGQYKSELEQAAFAFASAYGHLWASAVSELFDPNSEHYSPEFVLDFSDPECIRQVDALADEHVGPVGGQYLSPELAGGVYSHTTQTGRTTLDLWMSEGRLCFLLEISRPSGVVIRVVNTDNDGVARVEFLSPRVVSLPRHLEAARRALIPLAEFLQVDGVLEALRLEEKAALSRQETAAKNSELEFTHLITALKVGGHPHYLAANLEEFRLLEQKLARYLKEERNRALAEVFKYTTGNSMPDRDEDA